MSLGFLIVLACTIGVTSLLLQNTTTFLTYQHHAEKACSLLVDSGKKLGCDKFDDNHLYQNTYCDLFLPLRHQSIKMLEIGFGCGHDKGLNGLSALVWTGYFHNLDYYAIDYIPANEAAMNTCWADYEKVHPNVVKKLWIGDQSDATFLGKVTSEFTHLGPKWDVIIDDGAHLYDCIKTSFQTLWPYVADGGVYVVEDMAADYKFSRVVAKWIEKVSFGVATQHDDGDFENTVPKGVKTIQCGYQICVFKKASHYEKLADKIYWHPFADAKIQRTSFD